MSEVSAITITSTKIVGKIGTGMAVYLDRGWGFRPGDLVEITVSLVKRGDRA